MGIRNPQSEIPEGGNAIARLSDLVRKSEGTPPKGSKPPKKEVTLAFARMGSLLADTAADAKATDRPDALYQRVRQEVARILEAAGAGKPFEVGPLQGVALGLVHAMAAGDGLLVQALAGGETHLDLSSHMVNVAIFAVKIGQGVGYGEEDLRRLALAGCLHDVGMVTIPRRILEKPGPLSPEELALVRQHPEKGSHILQALGSEFDWLATVALQEQEREDGSGYPRGLQGDQIHDYAKIIGLADTYESLTHARQYRTAEEITRAEQGAFPDHILQGMLRGLSTGPAATPAPAKALREATREGQRDAPLSLAPMGSSPAEKAAATEAAGRPQTLYYHVTRDEVSRILEAVSAEKPFEVGPLQGVALGLVESMLAGDALLSQALAGGETHLDLSSHMVNVAIFAVKIGQGVGYGEEDLRRLALAGCLHDVGMVTIPRRILEKPGPLSPEELALVRQHPEKGSHILQALGSEFDWLATVALQEQEREDGSGYPRGLQGDQIHDYAKIIGLADIYDALIHPRPYQKRRVPCDAVKEIMTSGRRVFPGRILKGLIQGLSTFPVGSLVLLNSKEVACVVATNPTLPLRPVLEILTGPQGERLPSPRRIDLAQNTLLYITASVAHDLAGSLGAV